MSTIRGRLSGGIDSDIQYVYICEEITDERIYWLQFNHLEGMMLQYCSFFVHFDSMVLNNASSYISDSLSHISNGCVLCRV